MTDKPLMDIIRLWCIRFNVEYNEERKHWEGFIIHRATSVPSRCLYQQETDIHKEYNDVLIQALELVKSRASAACCVIESRKKKHG